jgi:hypothetical protein
MPDYLLRAINYASDIACALGVLVTVFIIVALPARAKRRGKELSPAALKKHRLFAGFVLLCCLVYFCTRIGFPF